MDLQELESEVERVDPSRQELVSYGQTVADTLATFLQGVRMDMADKQG